MGKNISYLETYKMVPAVLRNFDISLQHSFHMAPLTITLNSVGMFWQRVEIAQRLVLVPI
jgi:hypothetical protein